jgi:hypothetical protein
MERSGGITVMPALNATDENEIDVAYLMIAQLRAKALLVGSDP